MKAGYERGLRLGFAAWAVSAFFLGSELQSDTAFSATLASQEQAAQVVSIRNATVKDGVVSGELVNRSSTVVRDVQVLVRYTWLWKNEMHPGEDTRGDAIYYIVEGDIAPGGNKTFSYRPASGMASGAEGQYEVTVSVAGFAQVISEK